MWGMAPRHAFPGGLRIALGCLLWLGMPGWDLRAEEPVNRLLDDFDGREVDSTLWKVTGSPEIRESRLFKPSPSPSWSIYSREPFERRPGRALIGIFRGQVMRKGGPTIHFTPVSDPPDPELTGYGWHNDQAGPGNNESIPTGGGKPVREITDNADTFEITILRSRGAFHLLAGGRVSAEPEARLCFIRHTGTESPLFVGAKTRDGSQGSLDQLRVDDLGGAWAGDYGIAAVYDSFDRAEGAAPGTPEKGPGPWREVSGRWEIASRSLRSREPGVCLTETGSADGFWDCEVTAASEGVGVVFRAKDAENYWYFLQDATSLRLVKRVDGVESVVRQTAAQMASPGRRSISIRTEGSLIDVFVDDERVFAAVDDPALRSATRGGVIASAAGGTFDHFAFFHLIQALPTSVFKRLDFPNGQGPGIARDSFEGKEGEALASRIPEAGGKWETHSGGWTIRNGAAQATRAPAYAMMDVGRSDVEVSSTITLPPVPPPGDDWFASVLAGAEMKEDGNILHGVSARFLYQEGSNEIEVWEFRDGFSPIMNAVNIGGRLPPGSTHRLSLALFGHSAIACFDGVPVVALRLTRPATGTRAGIGVDAKGSAGTRWLDFSVKASARYRKAP